MIEDIFVLVDTIAQKERELDQLRRALAHRRDAARIPQGKISVLRCRLSGHAIALQAAELDEVVRMAALVQVLAAPVSLSGLLVLGTEHVPVIDLMARGRDERRALHPDHFIVLTRTGGKRCGVIVDSVEGLAEIDAAQVERPGLELPFGAYVLGVATIEGASCLLLSADALKLSDFGAEARP